MTKGPSVVAVFVLLVVAGEAFAHVVKPDRRKRSQQVERTMAADARVVISVCVVSGNLTVRGWDRNEVRARATGGTQIELARKDQMKSQAATELRVTSNGGHRTGSNSSCIASADIELDVPRAAGLKLETSSGDIRVTEVARVDASSQSGSMALSKLRGEVSLNTISGDISVHDSSGVFKLHTVGGGIDARNLVSTATGDGLAASTVSGEVTLDQVQIQTIKVNTVSGDIDCMSALSRAGRYDLQSISGRIHLSLPSDASFRLSASLGGAVKFNSDFKLNYSENQSITGVSNHGGFRLIEATNGSGDSLIKVSLLEGSLQISKRPKK
jgi:DUF4097 and DUF4098 domain-containing protein YvlB